ncbi:MAG: PAS domain S-box protein, partial [Cyclobacteriaceae bacterium]
MEDKSLSEISAFVIEDNSGDIILIEHYLSEKFEKFDLIHANTAKEAENKLTSFKANEPDVILLDLSLPDMSGEKLIKKILSLSGLTPVIILTGFSDLSFSIKSLNLGVSDYLIKDELSSALLQKSILYAIERDASSRKIKESEKNYRDLFQLSPEPMFLYSLEDNNFIDVNEASIEHYGYSKDEFLSMYLQDIIPDSDENEVLQILNRAASNDRNHFAGEFRHLKKNGEQILVSINTRKIRYKDRDVCIVISSDITQKREEEKQLRLLESVITNSNEAVAIIKADNGNEPELILQYVNDAFSRITGYRYDEAVGNSLFNLFGPETNQQKLSSFKKAILNLRPAELEIVQHKKDQSSFWTQLSILPVFDNKGNYTHWIYIGRDITERRKAEEEIRQSKNQYQSLVDNVDQTIYRASADSEFTFLFISPHIEQITGIPASDFINNNETKYSNRIHPKDRDYVLSIIEESIQKGRSWEFEYRVLHKDDTVKWVYEKGTVQKNRDGKFTHCDGFILDITEKKRAEMELETLNRQLEDKVEERTRQLRLANKDLESFSYSVSHNLRTPLRAIDGFSQAVLDGYSDKLDETAVGYLNRVRSASQKLSHLIDEFLNLARVSRTESNAAPVNLTKVAHSIIETLKDGDPSKKARITIKNDLNDFADPYQIKIVLQNLLE